MTPQDLIAAFEELADAPDGVKRLRELVLALAVRGKLVPQDPGDEPAADLLARIAVERRRLFGPSRRQRAGALPCKMPAGWMVTCLDELGAFVGGKTPSKSNPRYWDGSVPWVSPKDMKTPDIRDTEDHVTELALEDGLAEIPEGAVLVVVRSGILRHTVPVAIARVRCTVNQDLKALCPCPSVHAEYVRLLIKGFEPLILEQLTKTGTTVESMKFDELASQQFPLPPLAEQQRIVARVDQLMGLLDRLEAARDGRDEVRRAARDAAIAALRDAEDADAVELAWARIARNMDDLFTAPEDVAPLRQSILRLAVRGRLVPQDAGDAPVAQFLSAVAAYGASLGAKPYSGTAQAQWSLPGSWRWVPFGNTHVNRDAERVPLSKEERATRHGQYDYYGASGVIDSIDDFLFDKTLLLLGEDGANLALRSTPVAFLATGRYWVNNHAHVLDSPFEDSLRYLAVFINAIDLRPYLTGTAQPKLNQARMNAIACAVPPLAEQQRIVAKVDALMAHCDGLEARLTRALETQGQFAAAAVHHLDV